MKKENNSQHADDALEQWKEKEALKERLGKIKHKLLVLSGKGGVGKSTVATNIAYALSEKGFKVGLMDIDIHGPNIPKMLGIEWGQVGGSEGNLQPVYYSPNLKVMSIGFFLRKEADAVIWRGPLKMALIKQFLRDVDWGELDYLIVDSPPGTGDEPLSVCQLIEDADGALVITTPQDVALTDIRKAITFCRQVNMPVLGIVENMSGFICPHCGKRTDLFKCGGGKRIAEEMGEPFLGSIPIDPSVVESCDEGIPALVKKPKNEVAKAFKEIVKIIIQKTKEKAPPNLPPERKRSKE